MVCLYCKKEFTPAKGPGRRRKYCSKECRQAADRDNKRINYDGKREKICRQCGQMLPKYKTRFCCNDCKQRYNHIKTGLVSHENVLQKRCPICGTVFETWKSQKITCSPKCSRIRTWRKQDNSGIKIDYDISLKKLAMRDNDICQICHTPVDWDDKKLVRVSYRYGESYPSIDHIIPKSKGGLHCWDNVQLAHRKCNREKSNKL